MKDLYKYFASKNRLKIHQCLDVITSNKQDRPYKPDKPNRGGRMKGINFRNIVITVVVAALCFVSLAGAEEKEKESKIELIPVYEKTFDDTIIYVIFDETEITVEEAKILGWRGLEGEKSEVKNTIIYPKVVIKEGVIEFLDEKGIVEKSFSLAPLQGSKPRITVSFSKNRKFIGVVKSRKEFTMLNDDGETLWQSDIGRVGYGWPYISPDGQYSVCVGDITGDFSDYYPSIWNKDGFKKELINKEDRTKFELLHLEFTRDGNMFAATLHHKVDNNIYLCLYDRNGTKKWQKTVGRGYGGYTTISGVGNYIAVTIWEKDKNHQELRLYNQNGELCWASTVNLGEVYLSFSRGDSILMAVCEWASIYHFDIQSGKTLWFYNEKDISSTTYRGVLLDEDEDLYIVIGFRASHLERIHDLMNIFNNQGDLIVQKTFPPGHLFTKYPVSYIPSPGSYPSGMFLRDKIIILNGNSNKVFALKLYTEEL